MENQNAILLNAIMQVDKKLETLMAKIERPKQETRLTFDEKCKELKKTRSTLWRYVRDGKVIPIYIAGKPYFKPEKID